MHFLSLDQVVDILKSATIESTTNHGAAVVHVGTTEAGHRFVLVNDANGESCISYAP